MSEKLPLPISLAICDDVIPDTRAGKVHIIGWSAGIGCAGFPHVSESFNVFISLVGDHGSHSAQVVCFGPDGTLLLGSPAHQLVFLKHGFIVWAFFRIRNARFPAPGVYRLQFLCDNQVLSERPILLRLKGGNGDV